MKSSFPEGMTYEEKRKLFFERLESDYYFKPAKPKVPMIAVPITTAIAELAEANKKGVTLVIRRDDGVSLVVRPQGNALGLGVTIMWVEEVDEDGLPVRQARV
jgi:hypothetical protein